MALATQKVRIGTRIDGTIRDKANEILSEYGLDVSEAYRLFLYQVVRTHSVPFGFDTPTSYDRAIDEALSEPAKKADSVDDFLSMLDNAAD